jgi:hypothetical protein
VTGTVGGAVVAMVVLSAAGALPAVMLVGLDWLTVPAAPLAGAVLAAASAAGCLAVGGPLLGWFVGLAVVAAVATIAVWRRWPPTSPLRRRPSSGERPPGFQPTGHQPTGHQPTGFQPTGRRPPGYRAAGAAGAVVILAATAWFLVALRAPTVGFDARTIWMLHGVWFLDGHQAALAALRNPAIPFAHPSYPPLVGGSVAVSWLVTGDHGYRLGVVMVALLDACALAAAAWVAVDVGRRVGAAVRHRPAVAYTAGVVVAGLLVLAAAGVVGPFATNGYADPLWASAAVGAVGFGLVLPGRGRDAGAAVLLLAVAGLTKDEGIVTSMAIVVLMALRGARGSWEVRPRPRAVPWRPVLAGVVGVLALGAWPVLVKLLGATADVTITGPREGDDVSRAHQTADAMAGHLHVLLLALPVAVLGGLLLRRSRRASGIGNDGWAWAALAAGILIVAAAYVTGGGDVAFWLDTSVHRTTFFPALAAWWIVGTWAVVGVVPGAGAVSRRRLLDGDPGGVLHHQS